MEKNMKIKLVSYSQHAFDPALGDSLEFKLTDMQELVAYCARVSNPANQFNSDTSEKLIRYLVRNAHWSPLEMVSACIEITTTRDIARQILRHRSFSFQEFSQRYADPVQELDFVLRDARLQDTNNRQNSIDIDLNTEEGRLLALRWGQMQQDVIDKAKDTYTWAIDHGIAKEQARAVLPEGLTVSRLLMNGTLRSWIHYIQLRSANGTQKEHILIAQEIANVITKIFPIAQELTASSE
jgi:thymidylate synthase (FAD)